MPRPTKTKDEEISRDEAQLILAYLVDKLKNPTPKRGKFHFLHRTPADVAKEYGLTIDDIVGACRRKLVEPA